MERIPNFTKAESKILTDIKKCLDSVRKVAGRGVNSTTHGISVLSKLRKAAYENINQIPHEDMVLRAARSLQKDGLLISECELYWNARQTGDGFEPDLRVVAGKKILISAEVTTSEKPNGIIDGRMSKTLAKLNAMPGRKYYFVRTKLMAQRAKTKVLRAGFDIEIRII